MRAGKFEKANEPADCSLANHFLGSAGAICRFQWILILISAVRPSSISPARAIVIFTYHQLRLSNQPYPWGSGLVWRALFALLICSVVFPQSAEGLFGQEPQPEDSAQSSPIAFTAEQIHFFESRIRPLLIQHCLECHSGTEVESGLSLDSREAILTGGDGGPAVIIGDAKNSLLIKVVNHTGPYQMPPPGKLDEELINDLAKWIDAGLPWPAAASNIEVATIEQRMDQHRRQHWAFQPIVKPTPKIESGSENLTPMDRIVSELLDEHQLSFSPLADRRTLISSTMTTTMRGSDW